MFSCCVRLSYSEACPKLASWLHTEHASSPATSCPPLPPRSVSLPHEQRTSPTKTSPQSFSSLTRTSASSFSIVPVSSMPWTRKCFLCCALKSRHVGLHVFSPRSFSHGVHQEWSTSDLCGAIIGTGVGKAFCSGGDVASQCHLVQFGML